MVLPCVQILLGVGVPNPGPCFLPLMSLGQCADHNGVLLGMLASSARYNGNLKSVFFFLFELQMRKQKKEIS